MSFRAQLEKCHMLNPYPELNSRDTFQSKTTHPEVRQRPFTTVPSHGASHEAPGASNF
ncbi:hypothetical protein DEO72_LG5g1215 [Vigna unguiculata]|uniref:Uncharacterized protein n=1 Tax=Vigna unguiculata TaxID=3917 RepID=A0A4D6LZ60_VIGUN|nr:hypothetical protein DEO72_LG5g1215 [Vigna unguiculata]